MELVEEIPKNENPNVINFNEEISLMMFGFGDNQTPNLKTVQLVESVVQKQLRDMVYDITLNSKEKSFKTIRSEDIVFYLRHNKHKMQRFMKYLHFKNTDANLRKNMNADLTDKVKKRRNLYSILKEFVESIDETSELSDSTEFDTIKYSRNIRAERISSALDEEKYMEYFRARCSSFNNNKFTQLQNTARFNSWIDPQNEFNIRSGAVEVLSYLAYGIVANITDMVLVIRENKMYVTNDPLHMKIGHYHNSMMFNVPHIPKNDISGDVLYIHKGQQPISVNEIHEVLRRCCMPQVGYMRFSNKSMLRMCKPLN